MIKINYILIRKTEICLKIRFNVFSKYFREENMKKEQEELEKQLASMELKQKDEEEKCRQENTK